MPIVGAQGFAPILRFGIGAGLLIVGATAAVLSIPQDYSQRGSMVASGFILVLALIAPTFSSWKNDVRSLMRGENILIGALVYWVLLDVLQGAYSLPVSREAVVREFILLATAGLGFWTGATIFKPLAPALVMNEALRPWSSSAIFRLAFIAFGLGVWDFAYRSDFDLEVVFQALWQSRWESPWQREALGDWSAFSFHLQYFGYLVPPMAVYLAVRVGIRNPAVWIAFAMAAIIVILHAQGGGRRIVGAQILAALFCWLITIQRFNLRRLLVAVGAIALLAAFMQLMLIFRGVGIGDEGSELSSYDYLHIDDNFLRIAQMLEFVPDSEPFVGLQYVLYALVRPIPRALWPGKPVDGGFDLAELLGIPQTSFALTAAGELYVSFGYAAVFLGCLVYGRLSSIINAIFERGTQQINPLFPALLMVWLFVGVRSMLEIMLMGYVLLAVIALSKGIRLLDALRSTSPGDARRV